MTIYGVGYRTLEYEVQPRHKRWWPVLVQEFRTLFSNKWGVLLFLLMLLPSVASLVILLLQLGVLRVGPVDFDFAMVIQEMIGRMGSEIRMNARSVLFYVSPVYDDGFIPFLVLTSLVTSRGIAKDRQTNALEIYWTRGIGPAEYFLAKWLGSALLLGVLFVLAPLVLWTLGVLMAEDWSFLSDTVGFMPAALLSTALFTLILTYMATVFSAMSKSPNMAAILWLFLIVGTEAFANMLRLILRDETWMVVSPWESLRRLVQWMCGIDPAVIRGPSPASALVSVVVCASLLTALMVRRLRLQEAVT